MRCSPIAKVDGLFWRPEVEVVHLSPWGLWWFCHSVIHRCGNQPWTTRRGPDAPVQRQVSPSKALVKGIANELGIDERYLERLAAEVRKDLG